MTSKALRPDYSVEAETAPEHLKNALVLLGGLRRAMQRIDLEGEDVAPLVEAISTRLGKALTQLEDRPHAS